MGTTKPLRAKLIRDVNVVGVIRKAGEEIDIDGADVKLSTDNKTVSMLIGHGSWWDFVIGQDVVVLEGEVLEKGGGLYYINYRGKCYGTFASKEGAVAFLEALRLGID